MDRTRNLDNYLPPASSGSTAGTSGLQEKAVGASSTICMCVFAWVGGLSLLVPGLHGKHLATLARSGHCWYRPMDRCRDLPPVDLPSDAQPLQSNHVLHRRALAV